MTKRKEFDPDSVLPPGNPDDWSSMQWDAVENAQQLMSFRDADAVDDEILSRMQESAAEAFEDKPVAGDKSIGSMTDAEWAAFAEAVENGESPMHHLSDVPSLAIDASDDDEWTKENKDCDCQGPGSKDPKFATHAVNCVTLADECNCNGPGSKEEKHKSHTGACPQSPYYGTSSKSVGYHASLCKHIRQPFALEGGLSVMASAYRDVEYLDDEIVDIGVYMYDSWRRKVMTSPGLVVPWAEPPITHSVVIDWPDRGKPHKDVPIRDIVAWMLDSISKGVRIETACMGGHGRTGTMLALLLTAQGVTPPDAIERVRKEHCDEAIEGNKQVEYVADFYEEWHGNKTWRKSPVARKAFDKLVKAEKGSTSTAGVSFVSKIPDGGWTKKNPSPTGYYSGAKWDKTTGGYL